MTKYLLWDQINKNNEKLLSTQSITNQDLVRLNTNQKSNQLNRIKTEQSIINQNMKKSIHKQNTIIQNTRAIQEHRLGRAIKRIRIKNRLDHNQARSKLFDHQIMTIVCGLVGTIIKHL